MLAPYVVEALGEPLHIVLELADRGLRPSHVAYGSPSECSPRGTQADASALNGRSAPRSAGSLRGSAGSITSLLSWLIRGFCEGNSNLPQGDNPH